MNRQRHMIVWLTCLFMISCGRGSGEVQTEMRLQEYVSHLALPGEQGRVSGTLEEAEAANYITDQFILMGLSPLDRKSTRLNSSHVAISYAVFCLKKSACVNPC